MAVFSGSLEATVLLRLLLDDMPGQHQSAVELLQSSSGQFAVADIAIIELAFALEKHYQLSRPIVAEAIEGLMSLQEINCNRALFERALPIFAKSKNLSLETCCLAVYADLNNAQPLWTFDRKFTKQTTGVRLVGAEAEK